jgi:hypothetical protein
MPVKQGTFDNSNKTLTPDLASLTKNASGSLFTQGNLRGFKYGETP